MASRIPDRRRLLSALTFRRVFTEHGTAEGSAPRLGC